MLQTENRSSLIIISSFHPVHGPGAQFLGVRSVITFSFKEKQGITSKQWKWFPVGERWREDQSVTMNVSWHKVRILESRILRGSKTKLNRNGEHQSHEAGHEWK